MLYSKYFRLGLTAAVVALAVYFFIDGEIGNGIFTLLLAGIVVATYWFNEAMLLAFLALRKQDMVKAKKYLGWIKQPELMKDSQAAYYFYLNGLVLSQTREINKADSMFKKALKKGLRMDHDRAMAKVNLAGIAASRRRKREALNWLNEAKKDDKKKVVADQIKMMKQQLGKM